MGFWWGYPGLNRESCHQDSLTGSLQKTHQEKCEAQRLPSPATTGGLISEFKTGPRENKGLIATADLLLPLPRWMALLTTC